MRIQSHPSRLGLVVSYTGIDVSVTNKVPIIMATIVHVISDAFFGMSLPKIPGKRINSTCLHDKLQFAGRAARSTL